MTVEEKIIARRHYWFNLIYNWIVGLLIVALVLSCIGWAMEARTDRKAAALTATAMADWQAEQDALETARMEELAVMQTSEMAMMAQEANEIAKLFYGIDRFVDKYHYSETDLMTYARCVFNRVDSDIYADTVSEVASQNNQWTGYYDNNPVIKQYYTVALKAVEEWHAETIKPCSVDYLWAELTPNGIYLKNDFNANGYAIRWRYGQ